MVSIPRCIACLVLLTAEFTFAQNPPSLGKSVYWKDSAIARTGERVGEGKFEDLAFPAKVDKIDNNWLQLGKIWVDVNDCMELAEALRYYTDRVNNDPQSVLCRHNRATCLMDNEQWQQAIVEYDAILQLDRRNAAAYARRGKAKQKLNKYSSACRDLARAERLDPRYASVMPQAARQKLPIEKLIAELYTASANNSKANSEYRIRFEKNSVRRRDAVEQIPRYSASAAPAVPLLSRLIEDRLEPDQLRVRAIQTLQTLGITAVPSLPTLRRLVLSKDKALAEAARQAADSIEARKTLCDSMKSANESTLGDYLPRAVNMGDEFLSVLVDLYYAPSTTEPMRKQLGHTLLRIRMRHNENTEQPMLSSLIMDSVPIDTLTKQGVVRFDWFLSDNRLKLTYGREADQILLEQLPDDTEVDVIRILTRSLSQLLLDSDGSDSQDYLLDRALAIATALSRQELNMGVSGEDNCDLLMQCYRQSHFDGELQHKVLLCLGNYLKSCPHRKSTTSRLLKSLSTTQPPEFYRVLFPDLNLDVPSEEKTPHETDFTLNETVRGPGNKLILSHDGKYAAIFSIASSGTLFGGSLGGGSHEGSPVQIYDVATGTQVVDCGVSWSLPTFSNDGNLLATNEPTGIAIWDIGRRQLQRQFPLNDLQGFHFLCDRTLLCLESAGGFTNIPRKVQLLNAETGESIPFEAFDDLLLLSRSKDGRLIAGITKTQPWAIKIFDVSTTQEIANFGLQPDDSNHSESPLLPVMFNAQFSDENKSLQVYHIEASNETAHISQFSEFNIAERRLGPVIVSPIPNELGATKPLSFHFPSGWDEGIAYGWLPLKLLQTQQSISRVREGVWNIWDWNASPLPCSRELDWSAFSENTRHLLEQIEAEKSVQVTFISQDLVLVHDPQHRVVLDLKRREIDSELTIAVRADSLPVTLAEHYLAWILNGILTVRDLRTNERVYRLAVRSDRMSVVNIERDFHLVLHGDDEMRLLTYRSKEAQASEP